MKIFVVDMGGGKSTMQIDEDKSPTLTTTHGGAPAACVPMNWHGGQTSPTLTAQNCGGGRECPTRETSRASCNLWVYTREYGNKIRETDKCPTLEAGMYKWSQNVPQIFVKKQ